MKTAIIAFFLFFYSSLQLSACLNDRMQSLWKLDNEGFRDGYIPRGHDYPLVYLDFRLDSLDKLWKKTKKLDYRTDYGVLLILKGEYDKAEKILLEIEKKEPGLYATAANLGTLYELMGQNEKALHWIRQAVAINPMSHDESEWIHIKILEAKIGGDQLATGHYLLNVDFGTARVPVSDLGTDSLEKLRKAIYYQLNERVYFIKPKDKIVAALLFELANITWLKGRPDEAKALYQHSEEYGFTDPVLGKRRTSISYEKTEVRVPSTTIPLDTGSHSWMPVVLGSIVVVLACIFIYLRKRFKKN